jgi:hypothetical protein
VNPARERGPRLVSRASNPEMRPNRPALRVAAKKPVCGVARLANAPRPRSRAAWYGSGRGSGRPRHSGRREPPGAHPRVRGAHRHPGDPGGPGAQRLDFSYLTTPALRATPPCQGGEQPFPSSPRKSVAGAECRRNNAHRTHPSSPRRGGAGGAGVVWNLVSQTHEAQQVNPCR